jgi:phage-related tail fiber protein
MKEITNLDQLMNGALNERFNSEIKKVWRNVLDPNTDPKAKRKLTVTISLRPNQNRDAAEMEADVKVLLAPPVPIQQTVYVHQNDDGSVHAMENNGQLPGQVDMYGNINEPGEATFNAPDPETGEIPSVVQFKRKQEG